MHRKRAAVVILFSFFVLGSASCARVKPVQPEVNLMRLWVEEVTLSHVNLKADLRLFNPNDFSLNVQEVSYRLYLNGIPVSQGNSKQSVQVDPQSYGHIDLRLASAYLDIMHFLNKMQAQTGISYSLDGSVKVKGTGWGSDTFSFERQGVIPLEQSRR